MLNKWEKIDLVRRLGLNTEVNILITSEHHEQLDRLDSFIALHNLSSISLRTMSFEGKIKTPHYPILEKKDIFKTVREVLSQGLGAIVATPIDPKDALLAGAVMKSDNILYVELARGPCTVRKVTHDGIIDIKFEHNIDDPITKITVSKMWQANEDAAALSIMSVCRTIPFKNCIVEMSYYNMPVGEKRDRLIIWDIDGDGTPGSAKEVEDYYRKVNR